jgi:outer membrane receptor for ferrienterochelin and colicins
MKIALPPLRLVPLATALSTLFGSPSVHAQQAAPEQAAPAPVQTVEVQGSYDPRRDDTASRIIVGRDEIGKYGDTSVFDVLKRVPGVTVSGSGGRGTQVRMRGLGDGYVQILLDGERAPAGFSLDSVAPDSIERIEVLRAASAEYSTESIAGTINIVLKKVVRSAQRQLKANVGHGPAGNSEGATLQRADRSGALSYSLTAFVFQSWFRNASERIQLLRDAGGGLEGAGSGLRLSAPYQKGHFTTFNFTPRLTWTLANGDTLSAQTFASDFRVASDTREAIDTVFGALPAYPVNDTSSGRDSRVYREQLSWTHKFADGATLDAKLAAFYTGSHSADWRYGDGNPDVAPLHDLAVTDNAERGASSQGKLTLAARAGHALALGWDGEYSTRGETRRERDYLDPAGPVLDGDDDSASSLARLAAFAQDEWNVTPLWSMYAGARWEGIRIRTEGSRFATAHTRSSVFSPILQTLYKLPGARGDRLRLALTRTYKAPELQSLTPVRTLSLNNSQTEPDTIGNPNLKPELALGLDASWEHDWAEGALLSVSGSTRRITDATRNLVVLDDGRWTSLPTNAGDARVYSLELETKFPLKAIMHTAEALDLRASVARNWSRVDAVPGPDNRLDAQTPLSGTLGADYRHGALTLGGSYVFKSGGPVRIDADQFSWQSAHRDLDVYALWTFDPKTQLRLSGANLLAQDGASSRTYLTPGLGSQTLRTVTEGHRSVRAALELKI